MYSCKLILVEFVDLNFYILYIVVNFVLSFWFSGKCTFFHCIIIFDIYFLPSTLFLFFGH